MTINRVSGWSRCLVLPDDIISVLMATTTSTSQHPVQADAMFMGRASLNHCESDDAQQTCICRRYLIMLIVR